MKKAQQPNYDLLGEQLDALRAEIMAKVGQQEHMIVPWGKFKNNFSSCFEAPFGCPESHNQG